jgi:NADPH-dependent 2,4-dienoyl-CoA reductase/sulfur reductase-like enzyme
MKLTVLEPAKEIKVFQETDITVVGGGPAGIAAAIAAARNGAQTVLLERYGHLGGMATGGLVILIMPMSDGTESQQIIGICQEIIDRLDAAGAALHPKKEEIGSSDKKTIDRLKQYPFFVVDGRVRLSALVDPEILKCVLKLLLKKRKLMGLFLRVNQEGRQYFRKLS